jgi:choloylglycine hydrolase
MCTTFRIRTTSGEVVVGRTMEFALDLGWRLLVIPRDTELIGTAPDGPGHSFRADHGFVGVGALGRSSATDGINDAGLYAALLYLPGYADYQQADGVPDGELVSPDEVASRVLASAGSVREAIDVVSDVTVWNRVEDMLGRSCRSTSCSTTTTATPRSSNGWTASDAYTRTRSASARTLPRSTGT